MFSNIDKVRNIENNLKDKLMTFKIQLLLSMEKQLETELKVLLTLLTLFSEIKSKLLMIALENLEILLIRKEIENKCLLIVILNFMRSTKLWKQKLLNFVRNWKF